MSTNLTDDITPNASLNSFDPRLLVMFAKASYGDSCNNEIITGNTKTERMQSVLNSWVQANKTATTPWEIIDVDDSHSGFQGFAAGRDYDGDGKYDEIIFAFAGTNSLLDKVTSDFQILINQIPGQANKAEEFYNEVMYTRAPSPLEGISAVFADNINPNAFVTFTGHSLGGSIAQIMAVNHDKSAVTFNAPGMKWQCDAWESDAGVVNFVNMNDPIGCYRAHVGTTLYYMPDGIVNSEFKPHSDYFEQDFSKYITLPSSVQWEHHHAASLQIYDTKHKGLFTSTTLELWANKEYLEEAVDIVQKYFGSKGTLQRAHEYEAGGSIYFVGDKKAETIYAGKNDSLLYGNDGSDKIYGGKGDDSIYGGDDNDLLNGNRGNDKIYGGSGNDTINGGMGNDTVDGGEGYDTYSFTTGDGNDTISEGADYRDGKILINGAKLKSIRLDEETNEYTTNISDVTAAWSGQDGDDLVIYYGKENNRDVITIKNFADKDYDIEVKENGGGGGNGDGDGGGGGGGAGNIPDDDDEDTNNCICGNEECGHNNNPEGCECTPEDCLCGEEDKPHRPEDDNNLDEDGMLTTNHNRYEEDFNSANEAPPFVIDPVLIDLNGDGIKTTSVDKGAYFDHENDGFEELSAWVDDNDGILVIDKNNNKKIDGGNEIFGDNYIKDDGTKATSGFDALSDLDSNNDGKIDSNDEKFNDIKILKGDGTFLTLEEAGVVSIGLDSVTSNTTDENGNTIISQGTYTKTDGTTGTIGDFQLQTDKSISLEAAKVSVSSDIEELPDIKAHGMVHSLHQAMALDSTGELQQLVESYITASSSETKRQLVKQMLYKWTNAESVVPNSRGSNVDARDLHVLEQFLGEKFVGIDNTGNPNNQACNFINSAFSNLQAYIYAKLESKTTLAPIFDMLAIYHDTDADIVSYDLELIEAHIDTKIQEDASAGKELLASFAQAFSALGYSYTNEYKRFCEHFASLGSEYKLILDTADKSVINGSNDNDNIEGTAKDEVVFAGAGNDTIHSRQGNDVVYGEEGDDYIDTCEDDDYIDGGSGNDTILAGDGNDTVYGGDGDDSIDTGSGDDVIYGGAGNDTIINNNDSSDYIDGGAGNDNITTFGGHDTIIGGAGDDYINNSGGDDTYIYNLGDGNDTIQDVHGNDVIEFGEGITTNNIKFRGENNDMIIEFEGNEGSIRVKDCFNNEHNRKIDSYKFSDGTILSYDEVASLLTTKGTEGNDSIEASVVSETIYGYGGNDTILAGDGNDTVYGGDGDDSIDTGSGDDVIYGGAGNDTIINNNDSSDYIDGGAGNDNITTFGGHDTIIGGAGDDYINNSGGDDTYIYNLGDGNDTIQDVHGNDVIEFGEGITTNNIKFRGENNDMIIEFEGNEGSIRVKDCFNNEHNRKIDSYKFSDGTILSYDEVASLLTTKGTEGNDSIEASVVSETIYGYGGNDTILAGDGNDTVYGGDGDDSIDTGSGDDVIYGGAGNDTIINNNDSSDYIDGGAGNDNITTFGGHDTIIGGAGDDYINNSGGDDTYIYNLGDGNDTIQDVHGNDVIEFGEGITTNNIKFRGENNDMIIEFEGNEGSIRVKDCFNNEHNRKIDSYKFSDGTILSYDEVASLLTTKGTEGNDSIEASVVSETIYGYGGNDTILAGDGNDTVYGGDGDDSIDTGSGDDVIYGGAGNDTIINNNDSSDYIDGGAGNDNITTFGGHDTIIGGAGDDYINNSGGDDTYIYNLGDGNDTIQDVHGNDVIEFGEGITTNNIKFRGENNDMIIEFEGNEGSIRVKDCFNNEHNRKIDSYKFSDGTILSYDEVASLMNEQSEAAVACLDVPNSDISSISTPDINKIIQDMVSYNVQNDMIVNIASDINKEQEIILTTAQG